MTSALRLRLLPLLLLCAMAPSRAETFRVDDSASVVEGGRVRMKWDEISPGAGGANAQVSGRLTVRVRLGLTPWAGRTGRIYLTLPAGGATPVSATWTTRGRLLPGALRSGERSLVYAGPIAGGMLEDTLLLTLAADGRRLVRDEQLEFGFEIDPEAP